MTIAEQINAVIRRVVSTGVGHVVALEQTFRTTPADPWAACTEPERLPRWFEPVEGDFRQGGRYRLTGSGTEGTITRCEPPALLDLTWEYEGSSSVVTVRIAESPAGTRLTLEHAVPDDEYWRIHGPASGGIGWDSSLLALQFFLGGDPRSTPAELEAFTRTPEGDRVVTATAAAWEQAHVAAGADPAVAREAAGRTVAAYRAMAEKSDAPAT